MLFRTKPLPVVVPVAGRMAVRVVLGCAVTPVPVVTEIIAFPFAVVVIAVMNSPDGNPVPLTAMLTASPAAEGTRILGLPAVVAAPVTGTEKPVMATV